MLNRLQEEIEPKWSVSNCRGERESGGSHDSLSGTPSRTSSRAPSLPPDSQSWEGVLSLPNSRVGREGRVGPVPNPDPTANLAGLDPVGFRPDPTPHPSPDSRGRVGSPQGQVGMVGVGKWNLTEYPSYGPNMGCHLTLMVIRHPSSVMGDRQEKSGSQSI